MSFEWTVSTYGYASCNEVCGEGLCNEAALDSLAGSSRAEVFAALSQSTEVANQCKASVYGSSDDVFEEEDLEDFVSDYGTLAPFSASNDTWSACYFSSSDNLVGQDNCGMGTYSFYLLQLRLCPCGPPAPIVVPSDPPVPDDSQVPSDPPVPDDSQVQGDPHFTCPKSGTRFDFDGNQNYGKEFYALLSDATTKTSVNVAFETHKFSGIALKKLFTHMTELYVNFEEDGRPVDVVVSFGAKEKFPFLSISNQTLSLEHDLSHKLVAVQHRACDYMQPDEYFLKKQLGHEYVYSKTSNECTFVVIETPALSLHVVAVPAGLEADGVGINYLNVNIKSWKHSESVSGIISHCFDDSIVEGTCQKCFNDKIGVLNEVTQFHGIVSSGNLMTSEGFFAQGDHEFEFEFINV